MVSHTGPKQDAVDFANRPLKTLAYAGLALFLLTLSISFSNRSAGRAVALAASIHPHLDSPDAICRTCHQQIYDRYERTPMAQGSGLASDGLDATQLAAKNLVHRPSGVTYRVFLRDSQPYLSYSRPASDPRGALDGEHRLDFFVGSGRRGRTYLYQQNGLWFEAPINWYGKTQLWDMAPAFDEVQAMPDPLPVDPNCLHCHAGDVQPTSGPARNQFSSQPFRSGGVGCAACHGDPAEHLAQARLQESSQKKPDSRAYRAPPPGALASSIINPSRLNPTRRDSICLQCHLEGDAAVYLPGKSLQTFKPGDNLSASVTYFIDRNRAELGLRASSQYEALLRSACKRAVGDRLTCSNCHDPHSSPGPTERVAFFRARCLSCHTGDSIAVRHHPEQQDCALCHMPTRKTADISHEQLTDHDIEARPVVTAESPLILTKRLPAELIPVGNIPATDRELGLAYAQLAQRGDQESGKQALMLLQRAEKAENRDTEILNQLGFLFQISGASKLAAERYRAVLQRSPQDITAAANLAVIDASQGQVTEAVRLLSQVIQEDPSQTSAGLNLAFLDCRAGRKAEAAAVIEKMLQYNPDSITAHRFLSTGTYGNQTCSLR